MLLVILLVLALLFVQVQLPGILLAQQVGLKAQMGPRDDLPEPTALLGRARRALSNLQETLPVFIALALLSLILDEDSTLALAGAALYFIGRLTHLVCYLKGLSPWRSVSYLAALLGLAVMALPLLPHIWS